MRDDLSDQELARAARGGSREAFAQLVRGHYEAVYAFLFSMVRHRADAEDLTQECFLRAQRKLHLYNPERPFRPWVFAIARRLAIAHWRRQRPEDSPEAGPEQSVSPAVSARLDAVALWSLARRHLKPDEFTALWLHYREDLPVAEMARALGKTRTHAKVILHRARRKLRPHLEPEANVDSPTYATVTQPAP